jgi:hypothetical protein
VQWIRDTEDYKAKQNKINSSSLLNQTDVNVKNAESACYTGLKKENEGCKFCKIFFKTFFKSLSYFIIF